MGLSYVIRKDFLWSKAWNVKCVQNWQICRQIYPHLKLSSVADEVLADLYHFTESPFETVGRSLPPKWNSQRWQIRYWQMYNLHHFTESPFETVSRELIFTVTGHIGRSTGRSNGQEWQIYMSTVRAHLGRFHGRSTPQVDLPVELQFQIFTVRAHMGRSTGRSTHPYDLPVHLNGNFTFLLSECCSQH